MSKGWREPDRKESLSKIKSARSIRSVLGSCTKSGENACQKLADQKVESMHVELQLLREHP